MTGEEIAAAFTSQNDKVTWQARCIPQPTGDVVYFTSNTSLVQLEYDVAIGRWEVKFSKVQAKWGDYTGSVARSFLSILSTLKAAGLPFEAPTGLAGTLIETQLGEAGRVFVSWRPLGAPLYMPELAMRDMRNAPPIEPCPDCIAEGDGVGTPMCPLHTQIGTLVDVLDGPEPHM